MVLPGDRIDQSDDVDTFNIKKIKNKEVIIGELLYLESTYVLRINICTRNQHMYFESTYILRINITTLPSIPDLPPYPS